MARVETGEHLDPTIELSLETVKKRALTGVLALTGRTFILQIINRLGEFLLTIFLGVAQYGVFWVVSAVINFLAYFSDIGLAASLIQKKERPTREELKTVFTIQQTLVLTVLVLLFLSSPYLKNYYNLSMEAMWLLYALGFSFFLSSLKVIPSVLLEREIEFSKLIIPQIGEVITFNLVAVFFAWKGYGVTSFTLAVVVRGIVGVVLMYLIRPWRPGIFFSIQPAKKLFRFGIPYQANTFLAMFKDDGLTMFLGGLIGMSGMGLLGWAQRWAQAPLRFFMDQVIKVTFPAFSRMQNDKKELSKAVSRSIFFICLLVFPSLIGLITVAEPLTEVIPKYEKWQPALLALSLLGINTAWAAVTTPLTNLLNAIGKITTTFKLMIMWTSLTWVTVPLLAIRFGVDGAAFGFAIVGTSSMVAIWIIHRIIKFDLIASVGKPLSGAVVMGLSLFLMKLLLPISFASIILMVLAGIIIYASSIFVLVGPSILSDTKQVFYAFRRK